MRRVVSACAFFAALTAVAAVAEGPSVERGRELFESEKLGSSGKSCASCHPGGRKLEWAAASYEDERLAGIINNCIANPLKGKPLEPASDDLRSLLLYIKTFAGPGR